MRYLIQFAVVSVVLVILTASVAALDLSIHNKSEKTNCFARLENDLKFGDSLTVFTQDNSVIKGSNAIVNLSSSLLYMKKLTNTRVPSSVTIPLNDINRITYRKPAKGRGGLLFVGFLVGAVAGGAIGVAVAPEPSGFLDFTELQYRVIGGLIGGLFGAVGGHELGKNMKTKVTLSCK